MLRAKRNDTRPGEWVAALPEEQEQRIPAAMDEEHWQRLSAEQHKRIRESGLYDVRTDQEMKGAATPAKKDDG